jgi:hypothetical protein
MPYNRAEDQVARRNRFSEVHPEVHFEFHRDTGKWEAAYPAGGGDGVHTVNGSELGEVLDRLEEHFGKPGKPAGRKPASSATPAAGQRGAQ